MIKYILAKRNSSWGIQLQGGKVHYLDVVDFPTETSDNHAVRTEFVKKELGVDLGDYSKWKKVSNPLMTGYTGEFTIDLIDYPEESLDSILQKDYLIMYDDERKDKGSEWTKLSYWAVEGYRPSEGNTMIVKFKGVRDLLFEKNVKELFDNKKQVEITRGMPQSEGDVGSGEWNIHPDNDENFYPEEFENFNSNAFYPKEEIKLEDNVDLVNKIEQYNEQISTAAIIENNNIYVTIEKSGTYLHTLSLNGWTLSDPEVYKISYDLDNNKIIFVMGYYKKENNSIGTTYNFYSVNYTFDTKSKEWNIIIYDEGQNTFVDGNIKSTQKISGFITGQRISFGILDLYSYRPFNRPEDAYDELRMYRMYDKKLETLISPYVMHTSSVQWGGANKDWGIQAIPFDFTTELKDYWILKLPQASLNNTKYRHVLVRYTWNTKEQADWWIIDNSNTGDNNSLNVYSVNHIIKNDNWVDIQLYSPFKKSNGHEIIEFQFAPTTKKQGSIPLNEPETLPIYTLIKPNDFKDGNNLLWGYYNQGFGIIYTNNTNNVYFYSVTSQPALNTKIPLGLIFNSIVLKYPYLTGINNYNFGVVIQQRSKNEKIISISNKIPLIINYNSYLNYPINAYFAEDSIKVKPEEKYVKQILNNINKGFAILKIQTKKDESTNNDKLIYEYNQDGTTIKERSIIFNGKLPKVKINNEIENNYNILLLPHFELNSSNGTYQSFETLYPILQGSPFIYQITDTPYPYINNILKITINKDVRGNINIIYSENFSSITGKDSNSSTAYNFIYKSSIVDYEYDSNEINLDKYVFYKYYNEPFNPDTIAKLHMSSYQRYMMHTAIGNKTQIIQEYLWNKFNVKMGYTYDVMNNHTYYKINDLDVGIAKHKNLAIYNTSPKYGMLIEEINQFSFLQTNDVFNEYAAKNKESNNQSATWLKQQQEFIKKQNEYSTAHSITGFFKGLVNIATGGFFGGLAGSWGGAAGAAGGVGNAADSTIGIGETQLKNQYNLEKNKNDIKMLSANLKDTKNSPNQMIGNGDDLNGVLTRTNLTPIIYKEELWPAIRNKIAWYFQMYGVNLGSVPRDINKYLDNRYWFNYIQTGDIFDNFKINIPNNYRQFLSVAFQSGLHIWHVRDGGPSKIKDFNVANGEIS